MKDNKAFNSKKVVWSFFAWWYNRLNNLKFTDGNETIGVHMNMLEVKEYQHAFKDITIIDVLLPAALKVGPLPYARNPVIDINGRQGWRYEIYNSIRSQTEINLLDLCNQYITGKSTYGFEFYPSMMNVLTTEYADEKGRTFQNQPGMPIPNGYYRSHPNYVNVCNWVASEEWLAESTGLTRILEEWSQWLSNNTPRMNERRFDAISVKLADSFRGLAHALESWKLTTKLDKVYDLWASLTINDDHKIDFCLDKVDPIQMVDVHVMRTPVVPSEWLSAEELADYEARNKRETCSAEYLFLTTIRNIMEDVNARVKRLDEAFANPTFEFDRLQYNQMFSTAINNQVRVSANNVWLFSDVSTAARAMLDKEASAIIDDVIKACETTGQEVRLDLTNFKLHAKDEEGNSQFLPDEEQTIIKRMQNYIDSFSKAVQTTLIRSESEYFRPYVNMKLADLTKPEGEFGAGTVVNESDLLKLENDVRKDQ